MSTLSHRGYQHVGQLSTDDALTLLGKVIYGTTTPSPDLVVAGKQIVETLGHLALAVVQAGAYL